MMYKLAVDDFDGHHAVLPYMADRDALAFPVVPCGTRAQYDAALAGIREVVRDWICQVGADGGAASWTLFTVDGREVACGHVAV